MFAFGTNDFELNRCTVEGCRCLCELSASEDGTCKEVENIGYRLYKYRRFGKMLFQLCSLNKVYSIRFVVK